jgi:hypothetical protein
MLTSNVKSKSSESKFWSWFEKENKRFLTIQKLDSKSVEKYLDEILCELHKYDENLGVQVGGKSNETTELIITAGGNEEYFDKVISLVEAAPKIDNWNSIAFIPPVDFDSMDFDYYSISINDLSYSETLLGEMELDEVAVTIKVRDYDEKKKFDSFTAAIHKILMLVMGEKLYGYIVYVDIEKWDSGSKPNLSNLSDFVKGKLQKQQDQTNGIKPRL